jgi:hypothetical protein
LALSPRPVPMNDLYFVVLPIVHMGSTNFGLTEQILTLLPDKNLATEFFADEVDTYLQTFRKRADTYLTGGHVTGYSFFKEPMENGRFIVRVVQNVE